MWEVINTFETETHQNDVYKFSPYCKGDTMHVNYKDQLVHPVKGNNHCLF
jgi:hypothetical protein